jgi:hypothetical protein
MIWDILGYQTPIPCIATPAGPAVATPLTAYSSLEICQQIIIIIPSFAARYSNLLLGGFVLRYGSQKILQLLLGDLLSKLPATCQHDQSVLNIVRTGNLDKTDSSKSISRFGGEDLAED